MDILAVLFMLFCSLKGIFYAKYEFLENKNKLGGISILFIAVLGFILNTILIFN